MLMMNMALSQTNLPEIQRLVATGEWQRANRELDAQLARPGLGPTERDALLFQRERMARMRLDFSKTREQILAEARKIAPDFTETQFTAWEQAGAVELLRIDGQAWYFNRAAGNLFRVQPEARTLKEKLTGPVDPTPAQRYENVRQILASFDQTGERLNTPKSFRVTVTLTVKTGAVPADEIIRAWLPYPHASGRQRDVRLVSTIPAKAVLPGKGHTLQSVYLEQPAATNAPTIFKAVFEYTSSGFHQPLDPKVSKPIPLNDPALRPFLAERPPHLVFSQALRELSRQIVGEEKNPVLIARRLFAWVDGNIPWAGAREYSTLDSLSAYALEHRWGDCGIATMLFMSLCRHNNIPTRWQSGWTVGVDKNMHDWCEIYLAPWGWVPADVSNGMVKSGEERERWFFLGGLDSHRLVVNTDFQQPLQPAKQHWRSEIVDFQRGEVEWRGGNLFFNQWDCRLEVEPIAAAPAAKK